MAPGKRAQQGRECREAAQRARGAHTPNGQRAEGVLRLNGPRVRHSYRSTDQRAGKLIYLITNFLLGGTSCPEQVQRRRDGKGCQQSWSTPRQDRSSQGEAESTEELKVANLGISEYSVALQRRTNAPSLQPFIVSRVLTLQRKNQGNRHPQRG